MHMIVHAYNVAAMVYIYSETAGSGIREFNVSVLWLLHEEISATFPSTQPRPISYSPVNLGAVLSTLSARVTVVGLCIHSNLPPHTLKSQKRDTNAGADPGLTVGGG